MTRLSLAHMPNKLYCHHGNKWKYLCLLYTLFSFIKPNPTQESTLFAISHKEVVLVYKSSKHLHKYARRCIIRSFTKTQTANPQTAHSPFTERLVRFRNKTAQCFLYLASADVIGWIWLGLFWVRLVRKSRLLSTELMKWAQAMRDKTIFAKFLFRNPSKINNK